MCLVIVRLNPVDSGTFMSLAYEGFYYLFIFLLKHILISCKSEFHAYLTLNFMHTEFHA